MVQNRHGFMSIRKSYVTRNNGPQFRDEFKNCCRKLDIKHSTSSPYHPQGNGKAENAV